MAAPTTAARVKKRRAITDHINVLVKKLNGPDPLLRQEVFALLDGENLTEIPA